MLNVVISFYCVLSKNSFAFETPWFQYVDNDPTSRLATYKWSMEMINVELARHSQEYSASLVDQVISYSIQTYLCCGIIVDFHLEFFPLFAYGGFDEFYPQSKRIWMRKRVLSSVGGCRLALLHHGSCLPLNPRLLIHDGARTCQWPLVSKSIPIRDLLFYQQKDSPWRRRAHEEGWEMKHHDLTAIATSGDGDVLIASACW